MPVSRRSFVSALGLGGAGLLVAPGGALGARGREASLVDRLAGNAPRAQQGLIRLDSNENPNGPSGPALEALRAMLGDACRYPDANEPALLAAIAAHHGVTPRHVLLGAGSGELLRICVEACTSPAAHLVTAAPTFEPPGEFARTLGHRVVRVPVDGQLRLDVDRMAAAARDAGLVFFCNPNNPTGTVHGAATVRDFVAGIRRASPGTTILIDEAYHEYVEDPTYATAVPLAVDDPRVIVSRTFSKVFGMAGLRCGYAIAHPDTVQRLKAWRLGAGVNILALAAATASVDDAAHVRAQQEENRRAKALTRAFFEEAGFTVGASHTNFLMVDLRRDPQPFREACRANGVAVGRPFPPLDTWLRVSIGTPDEMRRATGIFRRLLA